ncbi:MAG: integrase [Nitrosomonas sp.]|nr:integrase [Nitrosomonas sp.]
MGRKPSKNQNLPKRMRARPRGGKVWYYYDTGGKPRREIPLGCDYPTAIKKWAELEMETSDQPAQRITFKHAADRYLKEVIPTKAPRTQKDNLIELEWLMLFFGNPPAPLDEIEPIHIRQYLDQRQAKTRANREKALFSHIWNKAREWGYTNLPNPCAGIKGHKEKGRKEIYIEDETYRAVYQTASTPLRDAMDLAYLTGQRPSDVLKMMETDITDGALNIKQNKTSKKLRISIEGQLHTLIERIKERKSTHTIRSLHLIVDETGQRFTPFMLRAHFDRAREKAGTKKRTSNSATYAPKRGRTRQNYQGISDKLKNNSDTPA